jgi:hypothetical protein
MTAVNSLSDKEGDVFIVSNENCIISARTFMLFMPVAIGCMTNDEGGERYYIVPLGSEVNCRNASISRLMDKMQTNLIDNGIIHALPGCYKQQERCNVRQEARLSPVLCGARDAIRHDYIFSPDIDFDFLKSRILNFLSHLSLSNCYATPKSEIVQDFKNASKDTESANDMLLRFMMTIDNCYNQFNEANGVDMYSNLLNATASLSKLDGQHKLPTIHHESFSVRVRAMREFQNSFGPFIVSIMKGSHRMMRLFMETFGCQHSDYDPRFAGFYLPPHTGEHEGALTHALTIRVLAYEKKRGTGNLTTEQLLSVSYNLNEQALNSLTHEDCHM